jgi:outer membrane lipoprotein-sorting protein
MNMKKLTWIFLFFLAGTALGDLPREQCEQRVNQSLQSFRQGGKIWKARMESYGGETDYSNFYIQYPGKFLVDYDRGNDMFWDGKTLWTYFQGTDKQKNTAEGPDTVYWILSNGEIGSNVAIDMLDQDTVAYYGEELRVVVADLVVSGERLPRTRMRLFVRGEGSPEVLGFEAYGNRVWLRDFHQLNPQKDPFTRSVL